MQTPSTRNETRPRHSVLRILTAAPHRVMFFGGALQLVLTMLFWAVELAGRYTALWGPLPTVVPATWVHGFLMPYGVFTFFLFGFLMTTYPRWMNGQPISRGRYAGAFGWLAAGMGLFYLGLFVHLRVVQAGLALFLLGWAIALLALLRVWRQAPAVDKTYEGLLNLALSAGWLGACAYLVWLLGGQAALLDVSLRLGIWFYLVPVLITVSHRMIPFFSNTVLPDYRVVQPRRVLFAMVGLAWAHGALELAAVPQWSFVVDLPLAALALYLSASWGLRRSFAVHLLAVLHVAFLGLGIAMALYAAQSLALWLTGAWWLGRAPLHALAIGHITAMVVGMASRVTLGHSGRALVLGGLSWALFWGVELTAVLRVAADLPALQSAVPISFNLLAALAWLLVLGAWAGRYAPMYVRPRVDGKEG